MSAESLRLLHASDFRLGQPIQGLRYIPSSWQERLRDAPYTSTERVFDTAIEENVDLVVLSGDLIDLHETSPYTINFLLEQFARLDAVGIPIYWASGELDNRSYWSKSIRFPENVCLFGSNGIESHQAQTAQGFQYSIVGSSFDGDRSLATSSFAGLGDSEHTTVAVCYGEVDISEQDSSITYWACGGSEACNRIESGAVELNYPGTPQPRSSIARPSGCSLISISQENVVVTHDISVATVHWLTLAVPVEVDDSPAQIKDRCLLALNDEIEKQNDKDVVITLQLRVSPGHYLIGPRQITIAQMAQELVAFVEERHSHVMVGEVLLESPMESIVPAGAYDNVAKDFHEIAVELWTNGWGQLDLSEALPQGMPIGMRSVREDLEGMRIINVSATFGANVLDANSDSSESGEEAA